VVGNVGGFPRRYPSSEDKDDASHRLKGDTPPVCPDKSEREMRASERQVYSVGEGKPTRARVRRPVAWMAMGKETELWEFIDKAIVRMVSELSGRNASEGKVASKCLAPEVEPSGDGRRQHGAAQTDRSAAALWRGGSHSTTTRIHRATGEALLVPFGNGWSRKPYNRRHREIGGRREGDGRAGSSGEAE